MDDERTVMIRDVLSPFDEKLLHDIVIRTAEQVLKKSDGLLNEKLANPLAIQMIAGYLAGLFQAICRRDGVDMETIPKADGSGVETSLVVRTRH